MAPKMVEIKVNLSALSKVATRADAKLVTAFPVPLRASTPYGSDIHCQTRFSFQKSNYEGWFCTATRKQAETAL